MNVKSNLLNRYNTCNSFNVNANDLKNKPLTGILLPVSNCQISSNKQLSWVLDRSKMAFLKDQLIL